MRRDIGVLCVESAVEVLYLELMPGTVQNARGAVKAFSRLAVKHRRIRLGISRPGREHFRLDPWQPQEDALLGTASDRELARRLGRSISSVRLRRIQLGRQTPCHHCTPEADALLGKMPDQAVARRLRRTVPAVSTRRKRMGIPASG